MDERMLQARWSDGIDGMLVVDPFGAPVVMHPGNWIGYLDALGVSDIKKAAAMKRLGIKRADWT